MALRVWRLSVGKYFNSYLGPSAPWMQDDDEGGDDKAIYQQLLRQSADALADCLLRRVDTLRTEKLDSDVLILEIRQQMAEALARGDIGAVRELGDLMQDILMARESVRL